MAGVLRQSIYNDPNEVDEEKLEELLTISNDEEIPSIGEDEVEAAIGRMKRNKSPGIDNVTVEELEMATQGTGLKVIHRLCNTVWEKEELPSQWKTLHHHPNP